MNNVILTEGTKERLKILSFLFQVSGYTSEVIMDLGLALESYQRLNQSKKRTSLLVVADYHHLGRQRGQRFEKLAILDPIAPSSVVLAAHHWTKSERHALAEQVPQSDSFLMCQSHQILDFVNHHCVAAQG